MRCFESEVGNIDCDFVLEEDNKLYCKYAHKECDFEKCVFYKNGVGVEDLKGLLIGIDMCGNPIYKD